MRSINSYFKLIIILLFSLVEIGYAQEGMESNFPSVFSPQTHDLGKYTFSPVSFYNGQPSVNIPVYTVKHFGVEIPISLFYDASGFIPNKASSMIGLNWSLIAGGMISRTVNSIPDEMQDPDGAGNALLEGFFVSQPRNIFSNNTVEYLGSTILENAPLGSTKQYALDYELAPDMFVFNFAGHTGKFMMGHDGKFKVESDGKYDIDITQLGTIGASGASPSYSGKIIITDANGIKYEFGGSLASIEYSYFQTNAGPSPYIPNAWYLTKIITPEGHEIKLIYANDINGAAPTIKQTNSHFTSISTRIGLVNQVVKNVYLRSIECKTRTQAVTQTVNFFNSMRAVSFSTSFSNEKLDSIIVKDAGNMPKKKFEFTYDDTSRRLFLNTFRETGLPPYEFSYINKSGSNIEQATALLDFWGFYNNKARPTTTPNPGYDTNLEMIGTIPEFEADAEVAKSGILSIIKNPLGGTTQYYYEGHDYNAYYTLHPDHGWLLSNISLSTAGGLRLAEVTISDGNGNNQTRQYKYVKNYSPGATGLISSGILNRKPNYFKWGLLNAPELFSIGEQHITYSEVAELSVGGGYTIHKFTSGEYPDKTYDITDAETYGNKPYYAFINRGTGTQYDEYSIINLYKKRSSTALERGKPSFVSHYNSAGKKISSISYTYNQNAARYDEKITSVDFPTIGIPSPVLHATIGPMITTSNHYFFNTQLSKVEETLYDIATGILPTVVTTTRFDYNGDRLVKRKTMVTSKGVEEIEKYKYVNDYISPVLSTPLKEMQERHILAPLIEKQRLQKSGGLTKLLEGTLTTFKRIGTNNATYRPFEVRSLELSSASTDTTISSISSGNLAFHSLYAGVPVTKFVSFDDNGNLLQYQKTADSPPISYKWGYNKQFPVAEIKNVKSEVLGNVVGPQTKYITIEVNTSTKEEPLTTAQLGTVTLTMSGYPGETMQLNYYIKQSGSTVYSGTLCADRTGSGGCYLYPETISIPNVPAGNYIISIQYASGTDLTYPKTVGVSYSGNSTTVISPEEFYFENFEDVSASLVSPHTGLKCFSGDFLVSWVKPAGKDYVISYWYRESGVWKFKAEQAYLGPMNLTGDAIDDIRIHPKDALMTTYTYDPLAGMTSQTDPKGMTTFYEYDSFQRLMNVRDQDGKIMSNTQYNYKP